MRISVVIPARDEEHYLPACLKSLHIASEYAQVDLELIVVLNRCTDRTEDIALEAGAICVHEEAKNLSKIRNAGIKAATSDLVVTIDADSWVSKNIFQLIKEKMKSDRFVGGGVIIVPERMSFGIAVTGLLLIPILLFRGLSAGLFFFRKESFTAIGGFDEGLFTAEDVDFARRLKSYGRKRDQRFLTLFNAYILTSCRKFDRFGDWYLIRNPIKALKLLNGRSSNLGDLYWYDVPRDETGE